MINNRDHTATASGWFFSHHSGFTSGSTAIQSNRPANGIQSHIGTVAVLLSPDSAARIVSGVRSSIVAMLPQRANNFFIKSASKFYDI